MTLIYAWALALAFVGFVSFSILGFGALLKDVFLGLGVFLSLSVLTGVVGGYVTSVQTAIVALGLVLFVFYFPSYLKPKGKAVLSELGVWREYQREWLWLVFPFAYWLARFFSAGLPQEHSDPLYYHLAAPRLWAELGRITIPMEHPSYGQTGLWETVFGIPQIWLGTNGMFHHVVAQLYGQWMHFLWGQVGSTVVAFFIFKKVLKKTPVSNGALFFFAWLCTTIGCFEWTGCLAKNDYIIVLFTLLATLSAINQSTNEKRNWIVTGLFAGFAFASKTTAAWFVVCLLFLIPIKNRMQSWKYYFLGAFAGAFPYLLRNMISTGNPVFPAFDGILGPGWLSDIFKGHFSSSGGTPKIDLQMISWFWQKALEGRIAKVLFSVGLGCTFYSIFLKFDRQKFDRKKLMQMTQLKKWALFLTSQTLVSLLMFRPAADGRYANYSAVLCLVFLTTFIIYLFRKELQPIGKKKNYADFFMPYVFLAPALLINIPLDVLFKIPLKYWHAPASKYVEEFHYTQSARDWVNENISKSSKIFFTAEKINFYLDHSFDAHIEMKKWERLLKSFHTADEFFKGLRRAGFDYAYVTAFVSYPPAIWPYFEDILRQKNKAVYLSKGNEILIFDLRKI